MDALELVEQFFSLRNVNVLLHDFERFATATALERHAARIDQRLFGRNVDLARGASAKDGARIEEFLGRLAALAGAGLLFVGAQRCRRKKREGAGGQVDAVKRVEIEIREDTESESEMASGRGVARGCKPWKRI